MDRTQYIPLLESSGKVLVFLRPRRTGKTLLIDTLHKYYDVLYKEQFTDLFGHLSIGENRTDLANKYLVFRIDFVNLNTDTVDKFERSMNDSIAGKVTHFIDRYKEYVPQIAHTKIVPGNAIASFSNLCDKVALSQQKIMVLIDEYDNAVNRALANMSSDLALYLKGSQSSSTQRQESIFKI